MAAAPPGWPYIAVGRVLTDGGGPCSGVLVAPALVLTVGHCVAGGRDWQPTPLDRLRVRLGRREHAVAAVRLDPASPFGADGKPRDLSHDWALLALAEPSMVPPVPYGGATAARRAYATDEPLTKVGWQPLPAGFASRLSDPDCRHRRPARRRAQLGLPLPRRRRPRPLWLGAAAAGGRELGGGGGAVGDRLAGRDRVGDRGGAGGGGGAVVGRCRTVSA